MRDAYTVHETPRSWRTDRPPSTPHPRYRLTPVAIKAVKRPGRYADGHGLYLVVDPSGAKRWIWRGVIHGKRSDLGLGNVDLVTLAEARDAALTCRRTARAGGNPLLDRRQARRPVPTFRDAAIAVHTEHQKTFRNAKHADQWLSSLEADVFPTIGTRPINILGTSDVLAVLTPIWSVKPETARRIKQRLKVVFDWAKASGYRTGDNPTDGIAKVLPKHRTGATHHAALSYREVPAFVATLRAASGTQETIRLGFELLILTATRASEVQLAEWREVDFASATWTIPGTRMKAGREHRIPLSTRALEILATLYARTGTGRWILPGRIPDKPMTNVFLKTAKKLTTATLTTHGFRSSFRDWAAEQTSVPRAVCEAALAHTLPDKTEAAYHRTDLFDRRRELMDRWARFATSTPAAVVKIRA